MALLCNRCTVLPDQNVAAFLHSLEKSCDMQRQDGVIHVPHNKYTLNVPGTFNVGNCTAESDKNKTKPNKMIKVLLQTLVIVVLISTV